jgi:S-adenosylmethionine:tRNA ribosyltransferase-isomerase
VRAASWPGQPLAERLLHVDPGSGRLRDLPLAELPSLFRPGDLLVLNDAATLPASLPARDPRGAPCEVRLAGKGEGGHWRAVLFGAGDWRTRTEDRPAPPGLGAGDHLSFGDDLSAVVVAVSALSPRLVELRFDLQGAALFAALYRQGRPVQYSYLAGELRLWHVQSRFASRPWAVEPPSAGRPLTWALLTALRRRGVVLARLTHAAGLSSTGDPALDAALPLPEAYDIPAETVAAILAARARGGRIVAAGTSVVRALESAAAGRGGLQPGRGTARLRLSAGFRLRVADGILTGLHEPGTSHFALLGAFASPDVLDAASRHAEAAGYLAHEFGDTSLVLAA